MANPPVISLVIGVAVVLVVFSRVHVSHWSYQEAVFHSSSQSDDGISAPALVQAVARCQKLCVQSKKNNKADLWDKGLCLSNNIRSNFHGIETVWGCKYRIMLCCLSFLFCILSKVIVPDGALYIQRPRSFSL